MPGARGAERAGEQPVAAASEAMAVVDGGEHVSVNQAYADLYGYGEPDALVGEPWAERFAEEDRPRVEAEIVPTCRADGRWRGEVAGRRPDGGTVDLELSVAGLANDTYVCTAREIGDDPSTGDSVDSERLLEHVFDAVDDILYIIDDEGQVHLWNENLLETTGYTDAEVAELDLKEFIVPEQHEYVPGVATDVADLENQHVDLDLVTKDGERIPHEFRGTTFEDPETGRAYRCGIARDIRERLAREEELERYQTIVETVDDGVYALDEDLRFSLVNDALCEMLDTSREELLGTPVMELFDDDEEASLATAIREDVLTRESNTGTVTATLRTGDGERILEAHYRLRPQLDGEFRGSIGVIRDVTEREERKRQLEHQRDELETLNRITDLLLEVTQDLFGSPTREDIEQSVCDHLAASGLYRVAWVGEPPVEGDRVEPRVVAGADEEYVATLSRSDAAPQGTRGPAERAFESGEIQASQNIWVDPAFERWRDPSLDREIRSAAAVPLGHGDRTYGILAVYSTRPLAFSQRERDGFETLGDSVGFAINAIENRKLLFADSVVELEFEVTDPGLVFVDVSDRLECELAVTGFVASETGEWSVYVTVDGAAPSAVRDVATDAPDVDLVRVLADDGASGLLEFVMEGPALNELTEHGAILTAGHVDGGDGRFCIEAPQTVDVRRLSDRLQSEYPDSTLVAQREFDRPARKAMEIRQALDDRLTDRQRETLMRAYHAGYFDWPRTSNASEVAESMDVAETTFHYHLRNALDTLLVALTELDER